MMRSTTLKPSYVLAFTSLLLLLSSSAYQGNADPLNEYGGVSSSQDLRQCTSIQEKHIQFCRKKCPSDVKFTNRKCKFRCGNDCDGETPPKPSPVKSPTPLPMPSPDDDFVASPVPSPPTPPTRRPSIYCTVKNDDFWTPYCENHCPEGNRCGKRCRCYREDYPDFQPKIIKGGRMLCEPDDEVKNKITQKEVCGHCSRSPFREVCYRKCDCAPGCHAKPDKKKWDNYCLKKCSYYINYGPDEKCSKRCSCDGYDDVGTPERQE